MWLLLMPFLLGTPAEKHFHHDREVPYIVDAATFVVLLPMATRLKGPGRYVALAALALPIVSTTVGLIRSLFSDDLAPGAQATFFALDVGYIVGWALAMWSRSPP